MPLKNSTFATVPLAPPRALSLAVAVSGTLVFASKDVPLVGESSVIDGGGLVSTLEPPVMTSE